MDSDVPSCSGAKKRRKSTDQIDDPVFVEFHSNEPLMALLNNSVSALKKRNEFSLCMLKISHCNGMAPKNFSKAFCQTERYKCTDEASSSSSTLSPKHVMLFSMSSIFCYGEELLCSFLKPKSETCLPQRKGAKIALSKLLYFLSEETGAAEKAFAEEDRKLTEAEWAVVLAHHLFSKLSVSSYYLIDKGYSKYARCPCGCDGILTGDYGDTSIGCPEVWHGFVDLMMGMIGINIATIEPDSPGGSGNRSSIEVKIENTDLKSNKEQMIAQSIVFSFLQQKLHPEFVNHLIPSIGISKEMLVIYYYDCKNDVLIESSQMPYIQDEKLCIPTIVALWLALNFKYFCSGITKGMNNSSYKAGFFEQVDEKLNLYMNVNMPCGKHYSKEDNTWTWLGKPIEDEPAEKVKDINKLEPW
ncbi:uncharacterized protein LOC143076317 [Mytilus galloprovincialis]|uniref:Uncharacterized protein n=1 Tax=Mytilus galloprovincialis TaxID=29158 RepID=A0A8B6F6S8_MYTGA|nr:Hypothetical predicted protein [Mytilus galloprovincialis]